MTAHKTLLAAGCAAALIAGCGEDDEDAVSKREYIARSNASCVKSEKKAGKAFVRIIGKGRPTAAEAQRFLKEGVVPALRQNVSERTALPPPTGDEKEIEAIGAAGQRAVAGFERPAADRSRAAALFRGELPDPARKFDALSRRYGIKECAGGE